MSKNLDNLSINELYDLFYEVKEKYDTLAEDDSERATLRAELERIKEATAKAERLQLAKTIFQQLGGNRFPIVTGASNFVAIERGLTFKLPSNITKNHISHVKIELTGRDDYDVTFLAIRGTKCKEVASLEGIYCDQLQDVIETHTGLILDMCRVTFTFE